MKTLIPLQLAAMAAALLFSGASQASDWGCQCLLCLADPRGPTTEAECVPPIERLWQHLAKGRAFPTCDLAAGPGGDAHAVQGFNHYEDCPAGTTALATGEAAMLAQQDAPVVTGIGDGTGLTGTAEDPLSPKVCVGGPMGQTYVASGGGDAVDGRLVTRFQRVVLLEPKASPMYVDVIVNGQLLRRVRY